MRPHSLRQFRPVIRLATRQQSVRYASWWPRRRDAAAEAQRVHVQKPLFNSRRLMLFSLYMAGGYIFFNNILGRLFDDSDWEEQDSGKHEVDEDGNIVSTDEDMDSWFIPMQYPFPLPRSFYRQSDPEWQEFVKMSWDEDRKNAVRDELANRVARDVGAVMQLKIKLGKDIKCTKYWLDIKYPEGPPPEYARKGFEIADDYIAWSTQVIPHSHYVQLQHILWPRAVFSAVSHSLQLFYHIQMARLKSRFGFQMSQPERAALRLAQAHALFAAKAASDAAGTSGPGQRGPPKSDKTGPTSAMDILNAARPKLPTDMQASQGSQAVGLPKLPVSGDMTIAWMVFANALAQRWGSSKMDTTPKGCFFVFGQVEVMGSVGRCKVDVHAAYDPKTRKYTFVVCKIKHFWDLQQAPKGGP